MYNTVIKYNRTEKQNRNQTECIVVQIDQWCLFCFLWSLNSVFIVVSALLHLTLRLSFAVFLNKKRDIIICRSFDPAKPHHAGEAYESLARTKERNIQCESKKVAPPKTFCNIFTQVKYISVKFCQYVTSLYLHVLTNFGWFVLIFNKIALIFLGVPIDLNVSSFKFHQVKSRWLRRQ